MPSTAATDATAAAARAWDDAAEGWSRHGVLIRQWLLDATQRMLDAAGVQPGQHVLDVAAGAGDQTLDLARRVGSKGRVLATDISAGILEQAAENLRQAGATQVQFMQADAQALGAALASRRGTEGTPFDAAVCRLGLMFCPEPLLALQQVHAALAPGARFCALVFSGPQTNPCITTLMRTALQRANRPPADPFTPGALLSLGRPGLMAQLMQEAGFAEVQVETLSAPFRTERCADYVEFVRNAGSPVIDLLKPLSAPAREAAWADITQQLEAFSTPQGWEGPNELLLCHGRKPAPQR